MSDQVRWRTSTVIDLCEEMRKSKDFSLLPILHDALMDAGFDDEEFLERLKSGKEATETLGSRLVAMVYSDESAKAVKDMELRAEELGKSGWDSDSDDYRKEMTYELLMDGVKNGVSEWGMSWQELFRSTSWLESFYADYELITGYTIEDKTDYDYSCTC